MLEFHKDTHTYWLDGKQIPSVSSLISKILGNQYSGVPESVLNKAAEFGTAIHEMIEIYNDTGVIESCTDPLMVHCMDTWIRIKREHGIQVVKSEVMVHYGDKYAGIFDCLAIQRGKYNTLIDFKTTYKLHKKPLTYQLNYYRMAYEKLTGEKIHALAGVWLPKREQGKLVPIQMMTNDHLQKFI